jgi:hypothetical protein
MCEADDEVEMAEFIIQNGMIQLGWIHVSLCVLGYGIYSFIKYKVMAGVGKLSFASYMCADT